MRSISAAAGLSIKTTEAVFGAKSNVLKELIDVLIAGDDAPVAISGRPVVAEMVAEPDARRMLALHARFVADISRRLGPISAVLEEAAATNPELSELLATTNHNRYLGAAAMVRELAARTALRTDPAVATDTVFLLLDPRIYQQLTTLRSWTDQEFVTWLADTEQRLLLP